MSRGKSKRTFELLDAARSFLKDNQPASVRAVCYRLFIDGLIPNMGKSATNGVSKQLTWAREQGLIPWEWIVDESREAESAGRWQNTDEIIRAAVKGYRRDYWQDQAVRVEVWSEKGTIRGTLAPVLEEYGVTFRVMHGYASATVVNDIAATTGDDAKPLIALYVGDWDPSGKHMSDVDLPRRLTQYGAKLRLMRAALLERDLDGLPDFDPDSKSSDPRYEWFKRAVGTRCYELDAMAPPLLRQRIEHAIRGLMDLDLWNHAREIERVEVESMREFHKSWQATKCEVRP